MEISIIGKEGFFKIFPLESRVEIVSSSFSAKGTIELDEVSLKQMIVELYKCKNCPVDSFDKTKLYTKNKEFLIEIRYTGDEDKIFLLGQYEYNNHILDFEFLSQKQEVYRCIEQIESFLKSEFTQN